MTEADVPRAVATGVTAVASADRVRPMRAAIATGVLAAALVFTMYTTRDVPGAMLALTGGASGGVARYGGVVGTYHGPVAPTGPNVHRDGERIIIDLPRIAEANAPEAIARLSAGGGLEFREVIEGRALAPLVGLGLASADYHGPEPTLEVDQWRSEDGGGPHSDLYLTAHSRELLDQTFAEATRRGWAPPPNTKILYEVDDARPEGRDERRTWRTYLVSTDVPLDGTSIAHAVGAYEPNTNRPVVVLEFTRGGADLFGELTTRISGHKLATVIGGVIKSAPIINGPIRGGRASITMGGNDRIAMEHERDLLVETLSAGSLPPGGTISDARWVAPTNGPRDAIARVLLALFGGLAAGAVAWLLVHGTRPEHRRILQPVGNVKLRRKVAWTLFAIVLYIVATQVGIPGLNEYEYAHIMAHGLHRTSFDWTQTSVVALGILPLMTSYVCVEVIASIVPRWRKLRDGVGRKRLELATMILVLLISITQAYFVVIYSKG